MKILVLDDFARTDAEHCCTSMFYGTDDADFINIGAGRSRAPVKVKRFGDVQMSDYSAVFVGGPLRYWNPRKTAVRNSLNLVKQSLKGNALASLKALRVLRKSTLPVIAVDRTDRPIVDNSRFPWLDLCTYYFKRELPTNPNNAFLYTSDKTEDSGNISRQPFFQRAIPKFKPISLGITNELFEKLEKIRPKKEVDLFFAGGIANRPNRSLGSAGLSRLQNEGYNVLLTDKKLSNPEYFQMAARSLICWSPEGFGYDCDRTYEVAALGSVPLLKYPPITCYKPFKNNESAIYYMHESFDIYDTVKSALQNREALVKMGAHAREHVRNHHTQGRIAEHLLQASHVSE